MADDKNFATEALPSQGGTYSAWVPEVLGQPDRLTPDGWRRVPTERSQHGVPGTPFHDGINASINMFSFAQAKALAWAHAACVEAETGRQPAIRVVEYRVRYDIKCYREVIAEEAPADGVKAAPTLICQRCKVDRYKAPCGDPHSGQCPMVGTTSGDQSEEPK